MRASDVRFLSTPLSEVELYRIGREAEGVTGWAWPPLIEAERIIFLSLLGLAG